MNKITEKKCDKFWTVFQTEISNLGMSSADETKVKSDLNKSTVLLNLNDYRGKLFSNLNDIIKKYRVKLKNEKLDKKNFQTIVNDLKKKLKSDYPLLEDSFYEKLDKNSEDKSEISFSKNDIKFKSKFKETIEYVFSYDNLPDNYSKKSAEPAWNRHSVISKMGVRVCPYCNRQYITNYTTVGSDNLNVTADLDHYYPKSPYPYLAMSLYNFIPSCQICNRVMKGEQEGHLNPYIEDFGGNARFSVENISTVLDKTESLEINILKFSDPNGSIEKSLQIFRLKEVYRDSHNQYILDMYRDLNDRQGDYSYFASQGFDFSGQNKKFLERFYINLVKKPYVNRIKAKEPLSRLTEDIMKQLGVGID